jgi:hypothetical protein
MKANYVERYAPEFLGGRVRGLEPEARELSVRLRDSISARFSSLEFHQRLLISISENERRALREQKADHTQTILSATWQTHFVFDDVVFNAASLCDYLGNAIWFGFHGANNVKKKWNNTYDAAKSPNFEAKFHRGSRIYGSNTGNLVRTAHESFVNDLYAYRSDLIHNKIDGPDLYSHRFWEQRVLPDSTLGLPRNFAKRLRRILPAKGDDSAVDIVAASGIVITRLGELTLEILQSLRDDLGWNPDEPLLMLG